MAHSDIVVAGNTMLQSQSEVASLPADIVLL